MLLSKKLLFYSIVAGLAFTTLHGCKAHEFLQQDLTSFAVTNAVAGDTLHIVLDGQLHTPPNVMGILPGNTSISQTGVTTLYMPAVAGSHSMGLSRDTGKTVYSTQQITLEKGVAYTFLNVGTQAQRKLVQLRDDLTLPAEDRVKVRFIHAAPTTGAVDITFARGTTDSVTISNRAFIGNVNDYGAYETFITVPVTPNRTPALPTAPTNATTYTVRVKNAGTGVVISSASVTLGGAYSSPQSKIYTAILRGGVPGLALSTAVVRNY